ncbi:Photosystem I assembly protein Ycf4 [Platanthera zijinensis]|uniref:Photosystem I assembly protein Ycf4 n=1 Tax=Platanthera zijinensis TaxID=2320716 RepID=A0AAP0C0A1_9ASPA
MSFYGIMGLFFSSYLWCTISWNVGSAYDRFDRKEGIMCLFRWGFPGINFQIFLHFFLKDIQSIRMEAREGLFPCRVIYMEIRGTWNHSLDLYI